MFTYRGGQLHCEQVALTEIAESAGTPCYIYSAGSILQAWHSYDRAFGELPHEICFAVKANSNIGVLALLAKAGSSFDIVSAGELYRVLRAGGDPARVVFSGVGKTVSEMEFAISNGIGSFNCESEQELAVLDSVAGRLGCRVNIALRVNPDVNASTHPYISTGLRQHKFGLDLVEAEGVYAKLASFRNLVATGVSCHIGSQILELDPILEAAAKVLALAQKLRAAGHPIDHVDLGGGLGIAYEQGDHPPAIEQLVERLSQTIADSGFKVMVEPGRSIVGAAGVLLTRVIYLKENAGKHFVIVDAAMNDLIRPALYQAHHEISPVVHRDGPRLVADVVGPVCETGDFLARGRDLPVVDPGDLLAIEAAGAYGFSQASNYNSRPRVAEVLVEGDSWRVIRQRESFEDLIRGEKV
jgi:diaminopimelate decarboxylase